MVSLRIGVARRGSGPDEPGDRVDGLGDLLARLGVAGAGGVHDAVVHVLLEQAQRDGLQGLRHRRDLGEDVDAVLLVLHHPLQPAGLALDAPQPLEVVVLAVDVAVLVLFHVQHGTPLGYGAQAMKKGRRPAGRRPEDAAGCAQPSRGCGTTPRMSSISFSERWSSASLAAMIRLVVSSTSPRRSASSRV